ncbi:hypothetical protein [Bradyrhizobium paxllaeri]|uniref:hypothetical protein n=1 Tax=Bradyrhizobium paxllaeri TaxID=190148 RepID=UPI000810B21D|nr:hypothetical protein [Bradyrhizobium paxllaeri]
MKKLAIVFAVGAAALMGGSAANAADNAVKARNAPGAAQTSTDFSAQHRHWRHHHHHHGRHHHWGHHHHRPYYRSYNYYAPRAYGYYGPRYYGHRHYGGPGVTFSFGSGW